MRTRWFFLTLGALVVAGLFAFPLWWPVINISPSNDALPGLNDLSREEQDVIEAIAQDDPAFAAALITTGLEEPSIVPEVDQALPPLQAPSVVARGEFEAIDAVRWAEGNVVVYQQADGSWLIRLEGFQVRNGPQLHLVLSAHPQPRTPTEVRTDGLGLDWGPLQGTLGNQNYAMPADFDMTAVESVVIYSIPYQAVFSSAQLIAQ